jgi:polysaccharide export outer membrane protein
MAALRWFAICALLLAGTSCANNSPYVWYTRLPRSAWGSPSGEYVIGIGDTISIRVYEQEAVSATGRIRRDGRIALPLVGELMVAGKAPSALARELETLLKQFIVSPRVTVNVEQSQPIQVTTLGEISTKGTITLDPPANMIQAIAQAGGLTEFADESRIFVLRFFPTFQRIRFEYENIVNNESEAATFPLRGGDVILVE